MGRRLLSFASLTLLALAVTACEQPEPTVVEGEGAVVATVNGKILHESELQAVYDGLPANAKQLPYAFLREQLLPILVNRHLMLDAAQKAGYATNPKVKEKVALWTAELMQDIWMFDEIEKHQTEERLRGIYDQHMAEIAESGSMERHARHILVDTEELAKDLIAKLDEGEDFIMLANAHSTDTAGVDGDLGYFGKGAMVKPFEDAAFALEVGSYSSEPVQSKHGWHIILVEDERDQIPPSFEEMRNNIAQAEVRAIYEEIIDGLREGVTIEYPESDVEEEPLPPIDE